MRYPTWEEVEGVPLRERYADLMKRTIANGKLASENVAASRALFIDHGSQPRPISIDVYTVCAGLPVDLRLQLNLEKTVAKIRMQLPPNIQSYWVRPENYQWEALTIKWPHESGMPVGLSEVESALEKCLHDVSAFTLTYRGIVITTEGTVLCCGYGPIMHLKRVLTANVPASPKQSYLGHISLGRILSPMSAIEFSRLIRELTGLSDASFGKLRVDVLKLVHETRWYMENRQILHSFELMP